MGEMQCDAWEMIVKGDFEPIVSAQLFQTVQEVMDGKRITHTPHLSEREDFPLRGLVLCEHCLKPVTAARSKGKRGDYFPYYRRHRASGHLNIRAEKVEDDFVALLDSLVPDAAQEAAIEAVFREVWLSKQSTTTNDATVLRRQISKLEERKARALEQKVDGELTAEEYRSIRSKTDSELIDATERLRAIEVRTLDLDTAAAYLRHTLWNTTYSWQVADFKDKRAIQKRIFPEGVVYKEEGFWNPVTSPLYSMLQSKTAEIGELVGPEGFEPPTKGL
jgi:site-specific DNA recombinase